MIETGNQEEISPFDVAVVGMAGRFPGASGVAEFERNLREGVCSISFFSDEELLAAGVGAEEFAQSNYVRARGWLEGIEFFDARYFGYSPLEAELMDPQHRIFLEGCVAALENAGYDSHRCRGAISVFAGVSSSPYGFRLFADEHLAESVGAIQALMGFDKDFVPTRASYKLNLKGASFNVQTACSTSLVAVHLACQSLLGGQADIALAGGVSIGVPEKQGYLYVPGGVSSPDGLCRAFDADGRGVPGGNGMGIVVLKRLTDAVADRDTIYAVVKGSAINNDGGDKIGFTAPSVEGQAACIAEALAVAAVPSETISYVETHGTATELGDPIEIAALTRAFATEKRNFCAVGSVKTNIGHLDVAAGVAGLIKATLAVRSGVIPPSLNYTKPNREINFAESPFFVNSELREWKTEPGAKRRAGVSSFGLGGTNAHLILEEAPARPRTPATEKPRLLILSAMTETALEAATRNLADFLEQNPAVRLDDAAFTLQTGRRFLPERRAVVCPDRREAVRALRGEAGYSSVGNASAAAAPPIVFMFPGGGAQYVGMARGLYESEPLFKAEMEKCLAVVENEFEKPLLEYLYPAAGRAEATIDEMRRPSIGLPVLFAVEYALAKLWMSFGVRPSAMIGHSLGEYAAACLAGVMSVEDAVRLVALRGRLFERLPAGMMINVALGEAEIAAVLPPDLDIAALNAPGQTLVAGSRESVERFAGVLAERGVEAKRVRVDTASHSRVVEPMLGEFEAFVSKIALEAPKIPYVSNVTGDWIEAADAVAPAYWRRHLRETVKFAGGVKNLAARNPGSILLEIGAGSLGSLAKTCLSANGGEASVSVIGSLRHPLDEADDRAIWLAAIGKLWTKGADFDWERLHAGDEPYRVALPTYPFEREKFWLDAPREKTGARRRKNREKIANWFYGPTWQREIGMVRDEGGKGVWLIFSSREDVAEKLKRLIEARGGQARTVRAGDGFSVCADGSFEMRPQAPDDYRQLLNVLKDENDLPERVLFFADFGARAEDAAARAADVFCAPLYLLQSVSETAGEKELDLALVTENFFDVTGAERLASPIFSTVAGIARTASQEFGRVAAFWADVEPDCPDRVYGNLLAAFGEREAGRTIAFRGRHRWRQTYQRVPMPAEKNESPRLRENGTYLLTGGLGGIALEIAEELARRYRAKLILLSRREFPARGEWSRLLKSAETDAALKRTLEKLFRIEEAGGRILIVSADAANRGQLRAALAAGARSFGKINGVIHAAGVFPGGMMQLKDREAVERVFAAKVSGTLWLDELLGDAPDFVAYFSSLNSLTGGFGQSDYCAANAFLDNFAVRKNRAAQNGTPFYCAINWDAWQETGGAFNAALPSDLSGYREMNLRDKILSREGVTAFFSALSAPFAQTIVSVRDFEPLVAEELAAKPAAALALIERAAKPKSHRRPPSANAFKAPRTALERQIAELWQELLGIEEIGVTDNFFELGGHSLLATQLTAWLKREYALEMPLRKIFELPTVEKWAREVERLLDARALAEKSPPASAAAELQPTLLVPFRAEGAGAPLVLIHAMSGTSSVYQPLVDNLTAPAPVFGIDALGLNGGEALESVEEMAEVYAAAIGKTFAESAVHLCGWSFGGLIAYETARRLLKEGRRASVILIDTPARPDAAPDEGGEGETLVYMAKMFSDSIAVEPAELARLDDERQLEFVLDALKKEKLVPAGLTSDALRGYVDVFRANCRAVAGYRPAADEVPVNLIRLADARATGALAITDKSLGWEEIAGASLRVKTIEGNHYTIVREPQVRRLAECCDEILFETTATRAAG